MEEPADGCLIPTFYRWSFIRIYLLIVVLQKVKESGYQELFLPSTVLPAEQVAKQGVPLTKR